jgi:hypothetical protein
MKLIRSGTQLAQVLRASKQAAKAKAQQHRLIDAQVYLERAQEARKGGDHDGAAELVAQARRILHRYSHVHHTTGG